MNMFLFCTIFLLGIFSTIHANPILPLSTTCFVSAVTKTIVSTTVFRYIDTDTTLSSTALHNKRQESSNDLSLRYAATTPSDRPHALKTRSEELYNLKLPLYKQEGYIALYLSNSTAVPFCEAVPPHHAITIEVETATLDIPIRGDLAAKFCEEVRKYENILDTDISNNTTSKAYSKNSASSNTSTTNKPSPTAKLSTISAHSEAITSESALAKSPPGNVSASKAGLSSKGRKISKSTVSQADDTSSVVFSAPSPASTDDGESVIAFSTSTAPPLKSQSAEESDESEPTAEGYEKRGKYTSSHDPVKSFLASVASERQSDRFPKHSLTYDSDRTLSGAPAQKTKQRPSDVVMFPKHSTIYDADTVPSAAPLAQESKSDVDDVDFTFPTSTASDEKTSVRSTSKVKSTTRKAPKKSSSSKSSPKSTSLPVDSEANEGGETAADEDHETTQKATKTASSTRAQRLKTTTKSSSRPTTSARTGANDSEDAGEEDGTEEKEKQEKGNSKHKPVESEASAAWGKMHEKRIRGVVYVMWTLLVLQVIMGFWEFVRHTRRDWEVFGFTV